MLMTTEHKNDESNPPQNCVHKQWTVPSSDGRINGVFPARGFGEGQVLHELAQTHEQTFAVTAVPDEKEGERLVVLHTLPVDRLQTCFEKLPEAGLANLWLPRTNAFFRVSSLPYLGTGKIDLRKIRELALELSKPHVPLQTHFA